MKLQPCAKRKVRLSSSLVKRFRAISFCYKENIAFLYESGWAVRRLSESITSPSPRVCISVQEVKLAARGVDRHGRDSGRLPDT